MSGKMLGKAWEVPDLRPAERLVFLALADCADVQGRNAFRSEKTIAEHCQVDIRTVKRAIRSLKERQLIAVQELPSSRRSTTYRLFPLERTGDILPPKSIRLTGDIRGDIRGDISYIPPRTPYKDDPVDPVDPGLLSLLTKTVDHHLAKTPGLSPPQLLVEVRRYIAARGWPISDAVVDRVITQRKAASA